MTTTNQTVGTQIIAGRRPTDGTVFIATNAGDRIDFPAAMAPHIAAMLAEFCSDNFERAHVESEWYELEDEDIEEMADAWAQPADVSNADLPGSALARFPLDPAKDAVVSFAGTLS